MLLLWAILKVGHLHFFFSYTFGNFDIPLPKMRILDMSIFYQGHSYIFTEVCGSTFCAQCLSAYIKSATAYIIYYHYSAGKPHENFLLFFSLFHKCGTLCWSPSVHLWKDGSTYLTPPPPSSKKKIKIIINRNTDR